MHGLHLRIRRMKVGIAALAGGSVVALCGGTVLAVTGIPGSNGVIYACFTTSTGALRVVPQGTTCSSKETAISWSQIGPQGPVGATGLTGATGAAGPTGAPGPMGPQGATGAQGPTGPVGPAGMRFLGEWSSNVSYQANDAVEYQGSTYIALDPNTGTAPGSSSPSVWDLVASQGATGATGAEGPAGPTGPTGPQGPVGPPGPSYGHTAGSFNPVSANAACDASDVLTTTVEITHASYIALNGGFSFRDSNEPGWTTDDVLLRVNLYPGTLTIGTPAGRLVVNSDYVPVDGYDHYVGVSGILHDPSTTDPSAAILVQPGYYTLDFNLLMGSCPSGGLPNSYLDNLSVTWTEVGTSP